MVHVNHTNAGSLPFLAPLHVNTSLSIWRNGSPENTSDLAPVLANHSVEAKKGKGGSLEKGQRVFESSIELVTCDLFDGRCVFDAEVPVRFVPFIDNSFNCFGNDA